MCAVRVGDGYSTNDTCKIRTCVGTDCATPETFIITPSANSVCTKEASAVYDIGCNENSPQYADCVNWFYQNPTASNPHPQELRVNDTIQTLQCAMTTPP